MGSNDRALRGAAWRLIARGGRARSSPHIARWFSTGSRASGHAHRQRGQDSLPPASDNALYRASPRSVPAAPRSADDRASRRSPIRGSPPPRCSSAHETDPASAGGTPKPAAISLRPTVIGRLGARQPTLQPRAARRRLTCSEHGGGGRRVARFSDQPAPERATVRPRRQARDRRRAQGSHPPCRLAKRR